MARPNDATEDGALTDFALIDPGIMGLNLFRPLPRKGRTEARKRMFEVNTQSDGRKLRVVGPYTLGADDLSVLLAVLALAGLLGNKIEAVVSETSRVDIVDGLESKGEVVEATHIRVRTTLYALCREAGLEANGQAYERINESLWRMSAMSYADFGPVTANARRMRVSGSQRLLSATTDEASGEVIVVINARFARFMLGPQFIRVDLGESRALGEMARLLHLCLSSMVRLGNDLTVTLDRLGEWMYGAEARTVRERQDRRKELRRGMSELAALQNWTVAENRRRAMFSIARAPRASPLVTDALGHGRLRRAGPTASADRRSGQSRRGTGRRRPPRLPGGGPCGAAPRGERGTRRRRARPRGGPDREAGGAEA